MAFCRFPKVQEERCQRDGSRLSCGPQELWAQGHRKKRAPGEVSSWLTDLFLGRVRTSPSSFHPSSGCSARCVREIDHLLDAHFHGDFVNFRQCAGDLTIIFFSPIPETSSVWSNPRSVQPCCTAFSARRDLSPLSSL